MAAVSLINDTFYIVVATMTSKGHWIYKNSATLYTSEHFPSWSNRTWGLARRYPAN